MLQSIKQNAVVQPDGQIIIYVPQLKPGTYAEVTVVQQVESADGSSDDDNNSSSLIGSCRGMFATPEEADEFLMRERNAWDS